MKETVVFIRHGGLLSKMLGYQFSASSLALICFRLLYNREDKYLVQSLYSTSCPKMNLVSYVTDFEILTSDQKIALVAEDEETRMICTNRGRLHVVCVCGFAVSITERNGDANLKRWCQHKVTCVLGP